MVTIDTTLGGENSNAYLDLPEAVAVYIPRLRAMVALGVDLAGWDAPGSPSDDILRYALIMGANRIDTPAFRGDRQFSNQARQFPREGVGRKNYDRNIPDEVKMANVAEAAGLLVQKDASKSMIDRGVQSYMIDKKQVVFGRGASDSASSYAMTVPALEILKSAGLLVGAVSTIYFPRG